MSTVVRPPGLSDSRPTRRRARWAVAIGVLAAVVAGTVLAIVVFGRDDTPEAESLSSAPLPTSILQTDEERVLEAVEGFFRVDADALAIPDPDHPLLNAYLTEPQLSATRDVVRQLADQGLAARPVPNSVARRTITVVSLDDQTAITEICEVGDGQVVYADTGEPAYEYPEGHATTSLFRAQLVEEFGSWKIAQLTRLQRWEGVSGCAVAAS